jgi:hypothetical protein
MNYGLYYDILSLFILSGKIIVNPLLALRVYKTLMPRSGDRCGILKVSVTDMEKSTERL